MRIKGIVGIFLAAMTMLTACGKSGTQLRTKNINESDKSIKSVEAVIPSPISEEQMLISLQMETLTVNGGRIIQKRFTTHKLFRQEWNSTTN